MAAAALNLLAAILQQSREARVCILQGHAGCAHEKPCRLLGMQLININELIL